MKTLIHHATIVNEGRCEKADLIVAGNYIQEIILSPSDETPGGGFDKIINAEGLFLLPGVIDEHVHFREPGLTQKADITTESAAAAAGGVTSYFDMPNTLPTTTSLAAWEEKMRLGSKSHVNYAFFPGATNRNIDELLNIPPSSIPGIKLFMGSSTGGMLVEGTPSLSPIFSKAGSLPVMTHCEDSAIINQRAQEVRDRIGAKANVRYHSYIRNEACCMASTRKAISLAQQYGTRLHIAHVSTAAELELIALAGARITAEACLAHLLFCEDDYARLGALIKCNPSIKTHFDRETLRKGLSDGRILTVATDHAPHLCSEKAGGCFEAASGMPMVQFSLPAMLSLTDEGVITLPRVVELMCHAPARLFGVKERGFIRKDYLADFVLVKHEPMTILPDIILSKCGWSPLLGETLKWKVISTFCNGHLIYNHHTGVNTRYHGQAITFDHCD